MGWLISYGFAGAHPGSLDSKGGHYNRKTGEYHYHGKARVIPPEPSAPHANQRTPNNGGDAEACIWIDDRGVSHASDRPPENQAEVIGHEKYKKDSPREVHQYQLQQERMGVLREKRINEYFRSANENVGALDCDVVIHTRDVNDATKSRIKLSFGNKCIICESTVKLEVDHRRALMNGGTNEITNLALLCDDCHTIKTKYDNSLRRKRESTCRKK